MAHSDEPDSDEYRNSIDNVFIYLSNVSPYYIFSVFVSFFAVFVVCWYRNLNNCFTAESQTTNKPDIEPKHVNEEELKIRTAKLKDRLDNMMSEFPDSLITEDFVHDESTEPSDEYDIEPKHVNEEELKIRSAKLKDRLDNMMSEFPDSLITEEFVHDESTEPSDEYVSPEDAFGGDGISKLQKRRVEKEGLVKSEEDVDPHNTQPNPLSRFKKARQAAIIERVTGDMSEEQLREEREAEASQIAAIWDLLKQQQEQFNIGTEQELQEQVHLYCL